jgi:FkbM family methyltransferase
MNRKLINLVAGRKSLQRLFELLYSASVYGMNYGNGGNFRSSGELFAAKYIKGKLDRLPEPYIFFDGGANKGQYSMQLTSIFSDKAFNIHAFEPSRETHEILTATTREEKRIINNNFGLGEKKETLILYKRGPLSGLSSVYKRQLDHFGIEMSFTEQIELDTIDEYCNSHNISRINFLKLDVEGHEYKCLLGASALLKNKKIDFIQFEFGGCNIDSRTYFQDFWYLLKDDYHIYRIVRDGLVPITKYNERLELFKNINFLIELKSLTVS